MAKRLGFRRIATRYDKLARNYFSALCLVAAVASGFNQLSLDPADSLTRGHSLIDARLVERRPGSWRRACRSASLETLHRDLSQRKVDLLIVRSGGPIADERLHFEFLLEDCYVVAAGAKNQWTRRRNIQFSNLTEERWVLPPRERVIGSIITQAFRASGFEYPRATRPSLPA